MLEVIISDNEKKLMLVKFNNKHIISRIISGKEIIMCLVSSTDFEINNSIKFIYNTERFDEYKNGYECFKFLELCRGILWNMIKKNIPIALYSLYQTSFTRICSNIKNIDGNVLEYILNNFNNLGVILKRNKELFGNNKEMYSNIDVFINRLKITMNRIISSKNETNDEDYRGRIHELLFYVNFQHKIPYLPFVILHNNILSLKVPHNEMITVNI